MCELEQVQSPYSSLNGGPAALPYPRFLYGWQCLHAVDLSFTNSLSFSFVICKMGKTIVIDLKDCCGLHQVTGMKCLVSVIHVGFNNY